MSFAHAPLRPSNPYQSGKLAFHAKLQRQNTDWYGDDGVALLKTGRSMAGSHRDVQQIIDTNNDGIIDEDELHAAFGGTDGPKTFRYLNKKRENQAGAIWDKRRQTWVSHKNTKIVKWEPRKREFLYESKPDMNKQLGINDHVGRMAMGIMGDTHTSRRHLHRWLDKETKRTLASGFWDADGDGVLDHDELVAGVKAMAKVGAYNKNAAALNG
jgi:hypothetical protein